MSIGATIITAPRDHLRTYGLDDGGLLFAARDGRPLSSSQTSDAWRDTIARMALPACSGFHAPGHYHATTLLASGINIAP